MGTTLAISFPLGRYHANPWDRAVNEGASEWPPSPWRLLRALVATWHTRWPDLPESVLEALLDQLGDPPSYRTPSARPGHTRHYLPDLSHRKGETGRTDLTLDPFLALPRNSKLLVRWEADLGNEQKQALAKLAELLPYLGRSESVCDARLLTDDLAPGETWWRPGTDGSSRVRLLSAIRPVGRNLLEATTTEVRKGRRTIPPGTAWVDYAAQMPHGQLEPPRPAKTAWVKSATAIRFAVTGRVPLKVTHGVLLADEAHRQVGKMLIKAGLDDVRRTELLGSGGALTEHRHAHWIPLPAVTADEASVRYLIVWVPQGLLPDDIAAIIRLRRASGQRGRGDSGYEMRGFPEVELLFQAAGPVEQVAPELCGPAQRWRSLTPYLPVRHRKRESLDDHLTADVGTELRYRPDYRDVSSLVVSRMHQGTRLPDRWAVGFRRYRMTEDMSKSRPGIGLRLEFAEPVRGPLLLGKLSHFGYGIFIPDGP
jgi:CRISPR-associated protein Csb2